MTLYLSLRSQNVGGSAVYPRVLEGTGAVATPALREVTMAEIAGRAAGRNLLFGVHGFNVSGEEGTRALARIEPLLGLGPEDLFVGVLWPGDAWLPVINYPFEGEDAIACGRYLADFCGRHIAGARSLSFFSHSLGARLVLEAVQNLGRPARSVCLTAGAINRDCLGAEYAGAFDNSGAVSILASRKDLVLKVAFQIGDPISDLLHFDHALFRRALGYAGPETDSPPKLTQPWQISNDDGYGHGNYLPPSGPAVTADDDDIKWRKPAGFIARAFRGQPQTWP